MSQRRREERAVKLQKALLLRPVQAGSRVLVMPNGVTSTPAAAAEEAAAAAAEAASSGTGGAGWWGGADGLPVMFLASNKRQWGRCSIVPHRFGKGLVQPSNRGVKCARKAVRLSGHRLDCSRPTGGRDRPGRQARRNSLRAMLRRVRLKADLKSAARGVTILSLPWVRAG